MLRPLALRASASGLAFESVIEDQVPDRLIGDPLRISQVLRNLAGNAIKFTNQGKVSVTCAGRFARSIESHACILASSTQALAFLRKNTG